ncbi:MAG: hypothetical protein ABIH41_02440 [Nanoarchaeota archaeon]
MPEITDGEMDAEHWKRTEKYKEHEAVIGRKRYFNPFFFAAIVFFCILGTVVIGIFIIVVTVVKQAMGQLLSGGLG